MDNHHSSSPLLGCREVEEGKKAGDEVVAGEKLVKEKFLPGNNLVGLPDESVFDKRWQMWKVHSLFKGSPH